MELRSCYIDAVDTLDGIYGKSEAEAIVLRLLQDRYGISKERLFMDGNTKCHFKRSFMNSVRKIAKGCPVQHITGFQEFLGRQFSVSRGVLVPRPETEELVRMVIGDWKKQECVSILDIGTGSGVIAVTLALELQGSKVVGVDVSQRALNIARKNAEALGADVEFLKTDFLKDKKVLDGRTWDIVISNPPYIPKGEMTSLPGNVIGHDPGRALFVSDGKPLIFYEKISEYAFRQVRSGGMIYFEINEKFGAETADVVSKARFKEVRIGKDIAGKERFVWGKKL